MEWDFLRRDQAVFDTERAAPSVAPRAHSLYFCVHVHAPCHEILPPFGCSYAIGWLTPHPLTSVHTVLFFLNVKGNKYCLSGNSYGVLLFLPSRFSYSFFLKRNNLPSFFSEAANATWDLRFTWKVVHQKCLLTLADRSNLYAELVRVEIVHVLQVLGCTLYIYMDASKPLLHNSTPMNIWMVAAMWSNFLPWSVSVLAHTCK